MDRSIYNNPEKWGSYYEYSVSTPGFHNLKRNNQRLPVKDYYWERVDGVSPYAETYNGFSTERDGRGITTFVSAVNNGIYSANVGGYQKPGPNLTDVRGIALNRVMSKVRNKEIDLGVTLGEYRETAAFVTGAFTKAYRGYKALRKGDVSGALRALTGRKNTDWRDIPGVASNVWLAYTYGLRPLVKDVYDVCERLHKGYQGQPGVIKVRSGHHEEVDVELFSGNFYNRWQGTISYRGEIAFTVENPLMRQLDQAGLVNPLSVAWELVPFSFVVDWFIPVGNLITGVVPPQGVSFVDGWVSGKARGSVYSETNNPVPQFPAPGWFTFARTQETIKHRLKLSSFPTYHLVVPDLSLSKSQIASGLALLFSASAWGQKKQHARPEPFERRGVDERNWRQQWPDQPWWSQ